MKVKCNQNVSIHPGKCVEGLQSVFKVVNDKFVIEGTDHLCAAAASSANIEIVVSYLDQTR